MPEDPRLVELRCLAAQQGGAFTNAQALACGYTDGQVVTNLRRRTWRRLTKGVYAEKQVYDAASASPVDQHRLAVAGQLLAVLPDMHASHRSAAAVLGLPLLGGPPVRPVLSRAPRRPGDSSSDRFTKVTDLPGQDVCVVEGLRSTTPARTCADVARVSSFRAGVVTVDAALHAGLSPLDLLSVAGRQAPWPGGPTAMAVAAFADGRAESPLESVSRVAMEELGIPAPDLQVELWVYGRFVARLDFLWEGQLVAGEADGMSKYVDIRVLREEKRRQEDIEAAGVRVVRWGWADVHDGQREFDRRIRAALTNREGRTLAPGAHFVRRSSAGGTSWVPRRTG